MRRIISIQKAPMSAIGMSQPRASRQKVLSTTPVAFTPCAARSFNRSGSSMRTVSKAVRLRPAPSVVVGAAGLGACGVAGCC